MEVLCERCHTEYDFDDALVSERGTTVKCTNCGHQFRIYRPRAVAGSPERWVVRTRAGGDLVFTSLRDLQRAITRGQVDRDDTLTREGLPSRRLAQIAELEPFFPKAPGAAVPQIATPPRERTATPRGLGTPSDPGSDTGLDKRPTIPKVHDKPVSAADLDFDDATVPRIEQAPGDDRPVAPTRELLGEEPGFEPQTVRKGAAPNTAPAPVGAATSQVRPPGQVVIREDPRASFTPTPSDVNASYAPLDESASDARFVSGATPRRSSAVRWVVGLVVLGGVVVLASTVGKRYIESAIHPTASGTAADSRVTGMLADADAALLDGDLERAKESLDKASVLAERDPSVLVSAARLADVRADIPWLRQKLLIDASDDTIRLNRAQLDDRARQAVTASERAVQLVPDDLSAIRVRVDALRLSGDLAGARKLVARIAERASEPEVAYVLAALDMSEASPNWATVVSRLRTAVPAERNLGRARAALIYALAQSGDVNGAQAELDALQKAPRPNPLLVDLKAFVARKKGQLGDGGAEASATVDTNALPVAAGAEPGSGEGTPTGSYQDLLARAHAARQAGQWDQAEALYKAVLAKSPGDTEALAGLGDVARGRGDKAGSLSYYEEVAKQNPGYIPALLGMADAKWDTGDRAGAAALYRQVLDRTGGQGPYAAKAKARLAEAAKKTDSADAGEPPKPDTTAEPPATTQEPPSTTEPPPTTEQPPPSPTPTPTTTAPPAPPGVDTSDLPGWKPQ